MPEPEEYFQTGFPQANEFGEALGPPTPAPHGYTGSPADRADLFSLVYGTPSPYSGGGGGGGGIPLGGSSNSGFSLFGPGASTTGNTATGYGFFGAGAAGAAGATPAASPGFWGQAGQWAGNNWQQLLGAGLSAAAAYGDASGSGRANSSGSFNTTGTSMPWLPEYNQAGLAAALGLLQQGGGGGGGGGQPFNYFSEDILGGLMNRVQAGDPLYGAGDAYALQTLGGGDANPYRAGLFESLGSLSDPYVDHFLQQMMGGGGGLFGGPNYSGGGGGGGFYSGGSQGAPGAAGQALGIADYIRPILEGSFLGEENPYLGEVISSAQDRARQAYMDTELPEINAQFEGAGRYGGSEFGIARALGADRLGQTLGDISSTLGFQGYESERDRMMQALGMGTEWDMHLGNLGAEYARIGSQNQATAAGAASASQDRALREWMARLGATTDTLGLRTGLTSLGAQGQIGLADLMSGDQNFALSMIPELSGLDVRDWTSALDRSLAFDELRLGQRRSDRAAGQAAARQPWENLGSYADIVRGLTGGYGTTTEQGFDTRQTQGGNSSNQWVQAALAALAGWQIPRRGE